MARTPIAAGKSTHDDRSKTVDAGGARTPRATSRREFITAAPAGAVMAGAAVAGTAVALTAANAPAQAANAVPASAAGSPTPAVPRLADTSQKFGRYRVNASIERPPAAVIEGLRNCAREVVVEHVGRSQIMNPAIKPLLGRDWSIVGPAVTVDLDAFDHLMCVAAIGVAKPGDVIVVAARGLTDLGVWGSGLTTSAKLVGAEAVVVDGAVMDTRAIITRDVPVFCRGSHPAHGTRERPGSVNVPVNCGGVIVNPGDILLGDLDGLVVVRREAAAQVLAACEEKTAFLRRSAAAMGGGEPKTFFDLVGGKETIRRSGVEWVD